jgi:hypothetical protein
MFDLKEYSKVIFCHRGAFGQKMLIGEFNNDQFEFMATPWTMRFPGNYYVANGYSEFFEGSYESFFPLTSFKDPIKGPGQHVLGVYRKKQITTSTDTLNYSRWLKKCPIPIVELGKDTTDSDEFFKSITHFLHLRSTNFDAFPHTLIEAITAGKQIIVPHPSPKPNSDGTDDVLSCITYHREYDPMVMLDNSESLINPDTFRKLWKKIIFGARLIPDCDLSFKEWLEEQLS